VVRSPALLALAVACAACAEDEPIIDRYPIAVSLDAGVPLLGARAADLAAAPAVIDTASPISVIDDGSGDTRRRRVELELLRFPLEPPVVRARIPGVRALISPVGAVGLGGPREIAGVIGGDVLIRLALRVEPARHELRLFPDVAGDDESHDQACSALFRISLAGGGAYVTGNDVVDFEPSRVVIAACLAPDPPEMNTAAGSDSVLVLATGVAPLVLSRTAYRAAAGVDDAAIDALPDTTLYLPSDARLDGARAKRGALPRLALVGRPERGRGPCRELLMSRLMARADAGCPADLVAAGQCPCADTSRTACPAASSVDLAAPVDVAILEDTDPLLQALRNELRPTHADVAGLLGVSVLGPLVTDIDYPGSRVIFRCSPAGSGCIARPRILDPVEDNVATLTENGCLR
jgi:hypothetical protein